MNARRYLSKFVMLSALLFCAFSVNNFSQTESNGKNNSAKAYLFDEFGDFKTVNKRPPVADNGGTNNFAKLSDAQISDYERLVLTLINQKRAENSLPPLVWSDEVAKMARMHSENMVKFKFFSHLGVDGKSVDGRANELGVKGWTGLSENIAYNRNSQSPSEKAVESWMASPAHRQNLLNEAWNETAIGIAVTNDGTFYFTQVFLKRR